MKNTINVENKSEIQLSGTETTVEGENSKSEPGDDITADSSEKFTADEHIAATDQISDSQPTKEIEQDSDTESLNVKDLPMDEKGIKNATDSLQNKEGVYCIDDVVNKGGYGKFQKMDTFLAGLELFADAFEIIMLSHLGDLLACDWTLYIWQNALLTSIVFLGMMIGAPCFDMIAEVNGFRVSLGISMILLFAFGSGSALAKNLKAMLIVRGFMGFAMGGIGQGVILCWEYYPEADRGTAGFYLAYYWAAGTIILILVTWGVMEGLNSWRWLLFVVSLPSLVVFLVIKCYPESARFYLANQQPKKAVRQLEELARMNKIEMPKGDLKLADEEEARGRILDLLKPKLRVSTLLMWYLWFAIAFTYYAFVLIAPIIIKTGNLRVPQKKTLEAFQINSTSNFLSQVVPCKKFNQRHYIDLLWTSAAEFPGLLIFTFLVKFLNRKTLLTGSCLISTCITFLFLVDTEYSLVSKVLLFLGRANLIAVFEQIIIMTTEAFPTTLRAIALGTGYSLAKLGGVVAPFAAQLLVIAHPIITICITGLIIFLAALSAAFLPLETKNLNWKELSEDVIKNSVENGQKLEEKSV